MKKFAGIAIAACMIISSFTGCADSIMIDGGEELVGYEFNNEELDSYESIDIDVRCCPIEIVENTTDAYTIDAYIPVKEGEEARIEVVDSVLVIQTETDGRCEVSGDVARDAHITIGVPVGTYDDISINTSNDAVIIRLRNSYINTLSVDTSNGEIDVDVADINDETTLNSSNSTILINTDGEPSRYSVNASTSNGSVIAWSEDCGNSENIDAGDVQLTIDTSNGDIRIS